MKHLLLCEVIDYKGELTPMLRCFAVVAVFFALVAPAQAGSVHISAAASLREAVDEIGDRYRRHESDFKIVGNYAASGMLAKQIENGAPADIFISASSDWVDYLNKKKRLRADSIGIVAYNGLVFVGRADRKVTGMKDLPTLTRIAIGSPQTVPVGEYALTAMQRAGIAGIMEKKLVLARDVREALMYAERGEVDGAFVYRTDALRMKRAKLHFAVPASLSPRTSYIAALTVAGGGNEEAAAFFRFLFSEEAHAVLEKYGFEVK